MLKRVIALCLILMLAMTGFASAAFEDEFLPVEDDLLARDRYAVQSIADDDEGLAWYWWALIGVAAAGGAAAALGGGGGDSGSSSSSLGSVSVSW